MDLHDVIAPVTWPEFVDRYLGTRMLVVDPVPGRFADLVSWPALNAVLNHTRFTGKRLRLVQHGRVLSPEAYLVKPQSGSGSALKSASFERCLADGATLVLDAVDELFPPVRELADSFEEAFRVRTQVNLYGGWRTQRGFDLHFDDHDTIVLQLHGRKRWAVYEPTRLHPLPRLADVEPAAAPEGNPVWEGILEDGAMLYMPRGWWHAATPLDEPSLHITVGLYHPTGAQMLAWFANELKATVEARMDVPHVRSAGEQQEWIAAMRAHMLAAWDEGVLTRFMAFRDARAVARPDVHLPDAARPPVLTADSVLRLATGRRLAFSEPTGDGTVRFVIEGKAWTCPVAVVPALSRLNCLRGCSVGELRAAVAAQWRPSLTVLLTAMTMGGAIAVRPSAAPRPSDVRLDEEPASVERSASAARR